LLIPTEGSAALSDHGTEAVEHIKSNVSVSKLCEIAINAAPTSVVDKGGLRALITGKMDQRTIRISELLVRNRITYHQLLYEI
jgi:hypothetical protein